VSSVVGRVASRWQALEDADRRRALLVGGGIAGVLGVVVLVAALRARHGPVSGADGVALAEFIRTPAFAALPAEQRVPYMNGIHKQMPEIEAARREGRIDHKAYRDAYIANWMTRRLDDMDDYYKQPPARRTAWLDRQFADDEKKAKAAGPATAPSTAEEVSPDGGLLYKNAEEKAKFDAAKEDFEDDFLKHWSPDERKRWDTFREQYKARRERSKAAHKATATTGPSPPPAAAIAGSRK
jgi:hypothetical protein